MDNETYEQLIYGEIGTVYSVKFKGDDIKYPNGYSINDKGVIIRGQQYKYIGDDINVDDFDISDYEELILFRVKYGAGDQDCCESGFIKKGDWYYIDVNDGVICKLIDVNQLD